jgi:peroxiredoxin
MKLPFRAFCGALLSLSLLPFAIAEEEPTEATQDDKPVAELPAANVPGPLAGHSSHGEAFDAGPRQAACLIKGTGKVNFPVTTKKPTVQQFINQGVGQLHGFWYFEAERSFRQAAALDPDCAIAYWGMAMANTNNEKRAKAFIAEAAKRKSDASLREALWIDALHKYYHSEKYEAAKKKDAKKADTDRRREYTKALENIIFEFPEDIEAKAFLAVHIWQSRSNLPITSHQAVDSLLNEVFRVEPNHPAHHYRIHLWDDEKPLRAVKSAALNGPAAPAIAHMWHMPGHTYSKLNRYADAAWQQEAASRVDHAYMIHDRVMPDEIHNYAHNEEWLIRDLLFLGRARQALDLAKNMIEMPRHSRYNTPAKSGTASFGRKRLIDTLSLYELWDETIDLSDTPYLEPTDDRIEQARRLRLLGMAWFAKGDTEQGEEQLAALEELQDKAKADQKAAGEKAEADARKPKPGKDGKPSQAKLDEKAVAKAKADAIKAQESKVEPLEKLVEELKGHQALAAGDAKKALEHFAKAKSPGKEFLSRVHLQAGDKAKAEQVAREAVNASENQAYPLANLADVLFRCEKEPEAANAFGQLRSIGAQMDLDLPVIKRLEPLIKDRNLPPDWRMKVATEDDIGQRPPLDSLGPVRWRPSAAPSWSLPAGDGKTVSLSDYRGKPVVVIFYLGFGCLHCVEQLKAFAPINDKFAEAGISLVAISTDSLDDLKKSIAKNDPVKIPFPLVSDSNLKIFKSYRAFDDFENQPLHATLLIDGQGLVRWQDISYDPFTDAKFLLQEAKRLLAIGK